MNISLDLIKKLQTMGLTCSEESRLKGSFKTMCTTELGEQNLQGIFAELQQIMQQRIQINGHAPIDAMQAMREAINKWNCPESDVNTDRKKGR